MAWRCDLKTVLHESRFHSSVSLRELSSQLSLNKLTLFSVSSCLVHIIQLSNFCVVWFLFSVYFMGNCLQIRWWEYLTEGKTAQTKAVRFPILQYLNSFLNLTLHVLVRMDTTSQRFVCLIQKYKNEKIGLVRIFRQFIACYLKFCTIDGRITSLQELFNQKKRKTTFQFQENQACMRCWSGFSFLFASSSNALEKRKLKGKHDKTYSIILHSDTLCRLKT